MTVAAAGHTSAQPVAAAGAAPTFDTPTIDVGSSSHDTSTLVDNSTPTIEIAEGTWQADAAAAAPSRTQPTIRRESAILIEATLADSSTATPTIDTDATSEPADGAPVTTAAGEQQAPTIEPSADTPSSSVLEEEAAPVVPETVLPPAAEVAPEAPVDPAAEVKDVTRPNTTLLSPTTAGPLNGEALTIRVDASDDVGLARITANIYTGSKLVKSTTSPVSGAKSATHVATVALASGTYTIRYNAADTSGNVSVTRTQIVVVDNERPVVEVKPESVTSNGRYRTVSFKLTDPGAGQIDKVTINGVVKDLTNNKWSDVNNVTPGQFGAREGANTMVVHDTAGNTTTVVFELDTIGPDIAVKPESQGAGGAYRLVHFKLHDDALVDKVTINGAVKDLTNNAWSDVNDVKPGQFGAVEGVNTLVAYDALGNSTTTTFTLDTRAPGVSVKPESGMSNGRYRVVSFKLEDQGAGQIDKVTINGVVKDLTNNKWSDVNDVTTGVMGAREGDNTMVVFDTAGNSTTTHFVLDTAGPDVIVKPETEGAGSAHQSVSFKLHDPAMVDKVIINGELKDLTNNEWSDVNEVTPGRFGAIEGTNTLVAYDALGNMRSTTFVLDTSAPPIVIDTVAVEAPAPESVDDAALAVPSSLEPAAAPEPAIAPTLSVEPAAVPQPEVAATTPSDGGDARVTDGADMDTVPVADVTTTEGA